MPIFVAEEEDAIVSRTPRRPMDTLAYQTHLADLASQIIRLPLGEAMEVSRRLTIQERLRRGRRIDGIRPLPLDGAEALTLTERTHALDDDAIHALEWIVRGACTALSHTRRESAIRWTADGIEWDLLHYPRLICTHEDRRLEVELHPSGDPRRVQLAVRMALDPDSVDPEEVSEMWW